MREKPEVIVKYICMGLGALLFIQFVRIIWGANPLAHVAVPDLPSLADDSSVTNQATVASSNVTPPVHTARAQNSSGGTNLSVLATNITATTNISMAKKNIEATTNVAVTTNIAVTQKNFPATTNIFARASARTNVNGSLIHGTNTNASPNANAIAARGHKRRRANQFVDGMGFMQGQGPQKTTVTPVIQASIDRITDSEIFGPVFHPLPMALIGIAGDVAFLRGPDGQTGLVKEGDELGSIKLIKIGTNRVLIEEDGQKQELTIFDGVGGQTLLDKSTNENNNP